MHETTFQNVPGGCSGPTGNSQYTNLQCAFSEGFADYFAGTVNPGSLGLGTFETFNVPANPDFPTDPNDPNGSRTPGAVTAFFYDLTDAGTESPYDFFQYPGTYVADVMATCKVTNDGFVDIPPDGIDHLIYCLENGVDTSLQSYFYGRSTHPIGYTESAAEPTGWSAGSIRTLWKKDLYDE